MTNHTTFPKVFSYLLQTVNSLYHTSVPESVKNRKNIQLACPDCLVITAYLWGILHACDSLKAKHRLSNGFIPNFIEYSRFTRRCRALLPCIQLMRQTLVFQEVQGLEIAIIDSFPMPLCQPIRNLRSQVLGKYANIGFNVTKKQHFYGCKCHALVSESGYVLDYIITPAAYADSRMGEALISPHHFKTVLGDKGYLGMDLFNTLKQKGTTLITPIRKNMKREQINFPNFSKRRKVIERVFSFLETLGSERSRSHSLEGTFYFFIYFILCL